MAPKDELKLGVNAIQVLRKRYLLRDEKGKVIETPKELFLRVARTMAKAEKEDKKKWENRFYEMMVNREFMPNTPALINAGAMFRIAWKALTMHLMQLPKSTRQAVALVFHFQTSAQRMTLSGLLEARHQGLFLL
jgi:hypothetical protein